MKHLLISALCALAVLTAPVRAEIVRVYPVDEAAQDPGFETYRASFIAAVAARDIPAMLRHVSPDVHLSFGGDVGHAAFVQFLTVPEDTLSPEYRPRAKEMRERYWSALDDVLRGGGRFEDNKTAFSAPYTWAYDVDLPEMFTPYETYFVLGSDVPLHNKRNGLSRVIATLDHEVLLLDWNELDGKKKKFLKVSRGNGQAGFVRADQVRSAVDYRARFERIGGQWRMVMFLAGD